MLGELCMSALSPFMWLGAGLSLGPHVSMVISLLEGAFTHCKTPSP